MRGTQQGLRALRQALEREPQLLALSERALSGSLAGTSASGAALSGLSGRGMQDGAAVLRLFSSLARQGRAVGCLARPGACSSGCGGALLRQEVQRVEALLWRRLFSEQPRPGWDKFAPKGKPRRPAAEGKAAKGQPPQLRRC